MMTAESFVNRRKAGEIMLYIVSENQVYYMYKLSHMLFPKKLLRLRLLLLLVKEVK